ncbi:MAG: DUF4275 family protein [Clostridia bacterium]|nr:DUF4275 family protein [Clostridia bacterium]
MEKKELYKKWLNTFASDVSASDLKKYVPSTGFIWHIFSWELLAEHQYLKGDEARKAYDKENKKEAMYIDWFEDDETKDITWELSSAKALDKFVEVYVVAKDFSWTYIKTHEGNHCGPYFMKLK